MTHISSSANPSAEASGGPGEGLGFAEYKEMIMTVCGTTTMSAAKKTEVRGLLENMHNLYTGTTEKLVNTQQRLISLLEEHSTLKDELYKAKDSTYHGACSPSADPIVDAEHSRGRVERDGALIWVTGGDIGSNDKSTEHRINIVNRIGEKARVIVTDSFFARDGRLGLRVSDTDRMAVGDAVRGLGFEFKILGEHEPELFIRDVGNASEDDLRQAIGDGCTSVYKKGLNAFAKVRKSSVQEILDTGIKLGWRLVRPELRHRRTMCYKCCAVGKSAHLAKDCPNSPACYKCGKKGHEGRACPGGPPRSCPRQEGPGVTGSALLAKGNEDILCNIRIIQINMGKSSAVFQQALACTDVDILAIQEPPRAHICRKLLNERPDGDWSLVMGKSPSRSAILLRTHVRHTAIAGISEHCDWSGVDVICSTESAPKATIRILSGYCPSDGHITMESCLQGIAEHVHGHHTLLCCDTNAWNSVWGTPPDGGSYQRKRGDVFEEWYTDLNLYLLNEPESPPTFRSHRVTSLGEPITSHIDVSLCSEYILRRSSQWLVDWYHPLSMISDHAAIKLTLSVLPVRREAPPWHNQGFFDGERFAVKVSECLANYRDINFQSLRWEELAAATEGICEGLKLLVKECRRPPKKRDPKPVWWTAELTRITHRIQWLRRRIKRTSDTPSVRAELRSVSRELKRAKRKAANAHAKRLVSEIADPQTALAFHRKWLRARAGNAQVYQSASDIAGALFPQEEADLPQQARDREDLYEKIRDRTRGSPAIPPLENSELLNAIRDVRSNSCPGEDSVPVPAIKLAIEREPALFCALFSSFLLHRRIPPLLKRGYVVTLPKGGSRPPWDPKAWRPITVNCALARVFDRVLYRRVSAELSFPPNLHAYRTGRSCDTAVGQLEDVVRKAWQQGCSVGALFVDIEGAFDRCSVWSSLKVLLEQGVNSDYLALLKDYLSDRIITVHHGSDSCERQLTRGIAQGGVTSPWVFNAFMLTFDAALGRWITVIYADDGVILFRYTSESEIQITVEAIANQLQRWCRLVKCSLSWSKTKLMCFPARKCHGGPKLSVKVGDVTIAEDCVVWLGLHLDRKFKWSRHVAAVIGKIEASYHTVRRHVRSTWGLVPEVALQFFDSVARGVLLHGVGCWGVAAKRQRVALQLRSLQAKLNRRARRLDSRTPTSFASRTGRDGITWDELCVSQCAKRRLSAPDFLSLDQVRQIAQETIHPHTVERFVEAANQVPYAISPARRSCDTPGTVVIYSDGSVCRGMSAGCGTASMSAEAASTTTGWRLPTHTTPFQAEVMGIWLAAVTAARQAGASSILILSDCLRAIDCLTRKNGCRLEGNSLVQDVLRRLRDLALPIFIKYTPSKQTEGNRRADSAARTAAVHGLDAELAVPVAREALSGILANRLSARSDQQYELEARSLGRSFKYFVPTASALRALRTLGGLSNLWRLISGRNNLRYSRCHVDGGSDACPFCDAGEQEDIMHFLYRCHRWCVQRQPLKAAVLVRGLGWPVLHGDALIRDRSLANAVELFISSTRRLEKGNPAEMT